jgi:hypothetical protein
MRRRGHNGRTFPSLLLEYNHSDVSRRRTKGAEMYPQKETWKYQTHANNKVIQRYKQDDSGGMANVLGG